MIISVFATIKLMDYRYCFGRESALQFQVTESRLQNDKTTSITCYFKTLKMGDMISYTFLYSLSPRYELHDCQQVFVLLLLFIEFVEHLLLCILWSQHVYKCCFNEF